MKYFVIGETRSQNWVKFWVGFYRVSKCGFIFPVVAGSMQFFVDECLKLMADASSEEICFEWHKSFVFNAGSEDSILVLCTEMSCS